MPVASHANGSFKNPNKHVLLTVSKHGTTQPLHVPLLHESDTEELDVTDNRILVFRNTEQLEDLLSILKKEIMHAKSQENITV